MQLCLLVPAPFDTVSGGYGYDRRMVAGLRRLGHRVDVVELAGRHPLADDAARAAAREALSRPGRPVIDGLALPAFAGLEDAFATRDVAGLIHHPTALETGFTQAARDALRDAERALFPRLPRIVVTSTLTGERLVADFAVDPARIRVVLPGTEDAPRSPGSGSPTCRILSVGSLIPRKGHDVLLRALARLFDLDWRLVIAGSPDADPVHARSLAALAEALGIGARVEFPGAVAGDALEALWRQADLFALATYWEGYGMALAEAVKRGLPVAVTAGGAAAALVPAEGGVAAPPGDHDALSKAMRRLIFDLDLRRHMADVAWQAGHALPDWDRQVAAFAEALDDRGAA